MTKDEFLQTAVSLYGAQKFKRPSRAATFAELLGERYKEAVNRLRVQPDKERQDEAKRNLPKFLPTGTHEANGQTPTGWSGLICLDFDFHDGEQIKTQDEIKAAIMAQPFTQYVGRSCRGKGLFALICVADPEHHAKDYYKTLAKGFGAMGIRCDPQANTPTKLRFVSYDPEAYFAEETKAYKCHTLIVPPEHGADTPEFGRETGQGDVLSRQRYKDTTDQEKAAKIENLVRLVLVRQTNITKIYEDWEKIAYILDRYFPNDKGRELFHDLSAQDYRYKATETDRVYTSASRNNSHELSEATFFDICGKYGIWYKENNYKSDFNDIEV